ncbi:uncharacterized protein LOC110825344 [Carica papaya]|uniref:uncharacterized protein LOC110825344 n=1 Tax=Carica papaya TaxID=3649 RepID=UPI000B8CAED6|nr:uncharacterized protein LOC110825344 [Carica papaya]
MSTTNQKTAPGLIISTTESIHSFLLSASKNLHLSQELKEIALDLSLQKSVPYQSIRAIWMGLHPSTRPELLQIFSGSEFIFISPKPRGKSEELKQRLRKLAEVAERNEYRELVRDITPKDTNEPFSSYKDQLGFGLHVALIMLTGYLVGYATFRALFSHNSAMSAAGGILGLVMGMLVETFLFIIRTSDHERSSSLHNSRMKKSQ